MRGWRTFLLAVAVLLVHPVLTAAAFYVFLDSAFQPDAWPAWVAAAAGPALCVLATPLLLLGWALEAHPTIVPVLVLLNGALWAWAVTALAGRTRLFSWRRARARPADGTSRTR